MNLNDSLELMKKYSKCEECGNELIGNGEGALEVKTNVFTRTCKCGWSVTVDKRIKIIASATKRVGRVTDGIYEVRIDDKSKHKYLPMNELKKLAGIKRANQFKKVEEWLNTKEGRKWALETPHISDFESNSSIEGVLKMDEKQELVKVLDFIKESPNYTIAEIQRLIKKGYKYTHQLLESIGER